METDRLADILGLLAAPIFLGLGVGLFIVALAVVLLPAYWLLSRFLKGSE